MASRTGGAAAHTAFKRAFHAALIDIASEASSPDEFTRAVKQFVHVTNRPTAQMWEEAVEAVRQGAVETADLQRWPSATPVSVDVAIMVEPRPDANVLEETPQHAVAA